MSSRILQRLFVKEIKKLYIPNLHASLPLLLENDSNYEKKNEQSTRYGSSIIGSGILGIGLYITFNKHRNGLAFEGNKQNFDYDPPERNDLPKFKLEEVTKHGKDAERIWVTFKYGVYDITDFIENHPGGNKILLGAGKSIEPFWAIYAQHKSAAVLEILESHRIGTIDEKDLAEINRLTKLAQANDPYRNDPERHPALIVNSAKPFNAETPPSLLMDHFVTPIDLFFVRNHMPVPEIDEKFHNLSIEGEGIKKPISLCINELKKKFKKEHVTSVIQCAGNRRADMHKFDKVQGLMWEGTAISNAKWSGVRLRDLLIDCGVDPLDKNIKHVHFEGKDVDAAGTSYGASIPFKKAMSDECIIAYEMNDQPISKDHGYPLRAIVPGNVGARQVKWLNVIRLSRKESDSHWQKKDYRAFSPSVKIGDQLDFDSVPAIQEYPIQSAVCVPAPGTKVSRSDEDVDVCGYAWSGGGRGVIRVEVSCDGGKTWQSAELEQDPEQNVEEMWAWTLWKTTVKIPEDARGSFEVLCKATDRAYNTQPETAAGIWNVRGLLHNAWHRVKLNIIED